MMLYHYQRERDFFSSCKFQIYSNFWQLQGNNTKGKEKWLQLSGKKDLRFQVEPHLRETTPLAQGTAHLLFHPTHEVFIFNLLLEKNVIWTYLHGAITWNIYWVSLCQRIWQSSKEQGGKNTPLLSTSAASQVTPRLQSHVRHSGVQSLQPARKAAQGVNSVLFLH